LVRWALAAVELFSNAEIALGAPPGTLIPALAPTLLA
jgi:hypothetical protein